MDSKTTPRELIEHADQKISLYFNALGFFPKDATEEIETVQTIARVCGPTMGLIQTLQLMLVRETARRASAIEDHNKDQARLIRALKANAVLAEAAQFTDMILLEDGAMVH